MNPKVEGRTVLKIPQFPDHISVQTVNTCNYKCVYCPYPVLYGDQQRQFMSEELFSTILDQSADIPVLRQFTFTLQNEPMLDPKIYERIHLAKSRLKNGAKVVVCTNGSTLNERNVRKVVEAHPDIFVVSINGLTEEKYKALNGFSNLKRVEAGLESLARERDRASADIQLWVNTISFDDIDAETHRRLKERWSAFGVSFGLANYENEGGFLPESLTPKNLNFKHRATWCSRPFKRLGFLVDGRSVLCGADWKQEVVIGDIKTESLSDIWHGEVISAYRQKLLTGRFDDGDICKNCMQADTVADVEAEAAS